MDFGRCGHWIETDDFITDCDKKNKKRARQRLVDCGEFSLSGISGIEKIGEILT